MIISSTVAWCEDHESYSFRPAVSRTQPLNGPVRRIQHPRKHGQLGDFSHYVHSDLPGIGNRGISLAGANVGGDTPKVRPTSSMIFRLLPGPAGRY